jgi:hypothetical protein
MNTECYICYDKTIITPCGAPNNCKAMVCTKCKHKQWIQNWTTKCYFCCEYDARDSFNGELYAWFEDGFNYNVFDYYRNVRQIPYILALVHYKQRLMSFHDYDFTHENNYCFPCNKF